MISDSKKEYNWRRLIPGLLVSAVSLAIVFWLSKPRELIQSLKLADLRLVALGVSITVIWIAVRAQVRGTYSITSYRSAWGKLPVHF